MDLIWTVYLFVLGSFDYYFDNVLYILLQKWVSSISHHVDYAPKGPHITFGRVWLEP